MTTVESQLETLRASGLLRSLKVPQGVDLTSNDYLGLSTHPEVRAALIGALSSGVPHGSTGSRLLSGHSLDWSDVERSLAAWQRRESALFLPSGYHANLALLGATCGPDDVVISDRLNHASLIDGLRLTKARRIIVDHRDVDAVSRAMRAARPRQCTVVVESVYSMDGDLAPLRELAELCASSGARLIVDEAHATGVFGASGAGRVEQEGLTDHVFASVHTAGKAMGLAGAFIATSRPVHDLCVNVGRAFVFSTAPPPFMAHGVAAAMRIIAQSAHLRSQPLQLARRLRQRLAPLPVGASASHIVPLMVGDLHHTRRLCDALCSRGWGVRPIRPPTVPQGTCRIRLVLNAKLTFNQVDQLAYDIHNLWDRTRHA